MLPRIAKLDREFSDAIRSYMQSLSRSSGVLREIKSHIIHEGRNTAIRRSNTELEATEMFEASVETKMGFDEIDSVNPPSILKKVTEISGQFEQQFSARLFETLNEVTARTGQQVDAGGKPLTNEKMLEMFEKMQMNFERSKQGDLTIVAAPGMMATFRRLEDEMNSDPEVRRKWNRMMEEKRNEFREREINRNLVG